MAREKRDYRPFRFLFIFSSSSSLFTRFFSATAATASATATSLPGDSPGPPSALSSCVQSQPLEILLADFDKLSLPVNNSE